MKAEQTRAGGRHAARERNAFERTDVIEMRRSTVAYNREPLINFLRAESLATLAQFCGLSVKQLIERY